MVCLEVAIWNFAQGPGLHNRDGMDNFIYSQSTMARKSQWVELGKRKLELSNLEKVLFPEAGILKAEVIQYYLNIAPTLLNHIKGRPLSLVRFPDGVDGEMFFQKNRPQWAPEWIDYVRLGKEKKDYMMATEAASLVWLANLACLEMHQIHSRNPHFDHPDYIVYDIDPPEGYPFEQVIDIAIDLRIHLEQFGYQPFVKTSGGKGVHILTPIEPKWDFHTVFEAASALTKPFVQKRSNDTTLHIKKEARKGKVLIDIYRNRNSQSIIGPYSLRGRGKAPVSMPLTWEQLTGVLDPSQYNIKTVLDLVIQEGDAWESMGAYAVPIHTKRKSTVLKKDLPPGDTYKTPEQLESYQQKRDFSKTSEPAGNLMVGYDQAFVVHRHHASRLHYDLRLEQDGTLKSWAVPRGLPPRPGIKRLAVQVEDHPIEYLTFEGSIPKGQYGGGNMWRYALGKYEKTKDKKNGFYFRLESPELTGEYRMHKMKDNEWLLERVTSTQINWVQDALQPMLSSTSRKPPLGEDYIYEVKWDGIRVLIYLDEGEVTIRSRSQRDITHLFPELLVPEEAFRATSAVFDGEIVCLDQEGKPHFKNVISRMHQSRAGSIQRSRKTNPAHCYLFDCLYLDGRPVVTEHLIRRREWLVDAVKKDTPYRVSEVVEDGHGLFEAAKALGLEGIMAKRAKSKYLPGKRTDNWVKVKVRQTVEVAIIGYTKGKGDRKNHFGALQIAEKAEEGGQTSWIYRGKVGSGFDQKTMAYVLESLSKIPQVPRVVEEKPSDDANTTWIQPDLFCELEYASITPNGTYREPVFIRLRPDITF
jgi:DNA ligase D-like protein (predicted polymerase)/DNA ligase D-like protein (predicted ligase)/DNA ligase D-like protein (predicted 3'-phosphoesterase)